MVYAYTYIHVNKKIIVFWLAKRKCVALAPPASLRHYPFLSYFPSIRNGINLNVRIECESFPQASHAVASGSYAAVLPKLASVDLPRDRFAMIDSPLFKPLGRDIHIVWNPRIIRLRSVSVAVRDWMETHLRFP